MSVSMVKNIQTTLKPFTKNGCRLLSKQKHVFDAHQKAALKNVLPEGASYADVVKIETLFGKGHKKITSIKDGNGKLLKRVISEFENDKTVSKTVNSYNILSDSYREVERKKYVSGEIVSEIRDAFSRADSNPGCLGHTKLIRNKSSNGEIKEKQIIEELQNGFERSFIETQARVLPNGRLTDKKVYANVGDVEELKKDPYLFFRSYNNSDFLKAIVPYAKKLQSVQHRAVNFKDKTINSSCLGYSCSLPFYKEVVVDSQKQSKAGIVDTVNHEFRHQWQDQLLGDFNFINFFFKKQSKNIAPENQGLARKLWKADKLYCPAEINYKKYYDNFKEVDARAAGEKAEMEYVEYTNKIIDLFRCMDKSLFGCVDLRNASVIFTDWLKKNADKIQTVTLPPIKLS